MNHLALRFLIFLAPAASMTAFVAASASAVAIADDAPAAADRIERDIEGWKVTIDSQLFADANRAEGEESLKALANHLQRVRFIVPPSKVAQLQQLPIWIDWHHQLDNMQYHPSEKWLSSNGYDPRLARHVHVPRAKQLTDPGQWAKHPYCILHELAHAFHDQVLGFDEPRIIDTFNKMKQSGTYKEVLLYTGRKVEHYALSNHKEYFAESTEAFFGVNDFYPFVRAELNEHDPAMHRLLESIWSDSRP